MTILNDVKAARPQLRPKAETADRRISRIENFGITVNSFTFRSLSGFRQAFLRRRMGCEKTERPFQICRSLPLVD
jgi:hypothetical protein